MEVGREGIEPSRVAPGDFKSPASTVSPPPRAGSGAVRDMILTCLGRFVNRFYRFYGFDQSAKHSSQSY